MSSSSFKSDSSYSGSASGAAFVFLGLFFFAFASLSIPSTERVFFGILARAGRLVVVGDFASVSVGEAAASFVAAALAATSDPDEDDELDETVVVGGGAAVSELEDDVACRGMVDQGATRCRDALAVDLPKLPCQHPVWVNSVSGGQGFRSPLALRWQTVTPVHVCAATLNCGASRPDTTVHNYL